MNGSFILGLQLGQLQTNLKENLKHPIVHHYSKSISDPPIVGYRWFVKTSDDKLGGLHHTSIVQYHDQRSGVVVTENTVYIPS